MLKVFYIKLISIGICLTMTGCAWYEETYKNPDRECNTVNIGLLEPINCRAFIDLKCLTPQIPMNTASEPNNQTQNVQIYVEADNNLLSQVVGKLLAHNAHPIYTKEPPGVILQADISTIFQRHGYQVVSDRSDASYSVLAKWAYLDVRSETGWWKGYHHASAEYSIRVLDKKGSLISENLFSGQDSSEFAYAYLEDYEATLGKAYCSALNQFSNTLKRTGVSQLVTNKP